MPTTVAIAEASLILGAVAALALVVSGRTGRSISTDRWVALAVLWVGLIIMVAAASLLSEVYLRMAAVVLPLLLISALLIGRRVGSGSWDRASNVRSLNPVVLASGIAVGLLGLVVYILESAR